MAKRNSAWMALECARLSRDILGANGVSDDYPIMRHLMNLESVKTYEGTKDVLCGHASLTVLVNFQWRTNEVPANTRPNFTHGWLS